MTPRVLAIVVTYNPELSRLTSLLDSLIGQVDATIVVDNGSKSDVGAFLADRHLTAEHYVGLAFNQGIAAAHNCGIAFARERGFRYVILFDHDSVANPGMIGLLVQAAEARSARGELVAAIGPNLFDERLGRGTHFERARRAEPEDGLVRVDHVISSGCLIPIAALDRVGDMRSELFIDYVDTEWCLRAGARGLHCYGSVHAKMSHEFGEPMYVFGHAFAAHTPMRHYYLFRNSIWLWRQKWVPIHWRCSAGLRTILRLGFSIVFAKPHMAQWKMMWRGLRDGIHGRQGMGHE